MKFYTSIIVGAIGSLLASVVYSVIDHMWGTPLTRTETTLIFGLSTLVIIAPSIFLFLKFTEKKLRQKFHDEFIDSGQLFNFESLNNKIGIVGTYNNFNVCEKEILEEIKKSKSIKIFLQMGKTVMSGGTNFYDYLCQQRLKDNADVKVLHASQDNPYLSESQAINRKSDYNEWLTDLDHAAKKVDNLIKKNGPKLEGRQHTEGFVWRMFIFDNNAYIQPYLHKRNNSKQAPVIKLSRLLSNNDKIETNENSLFIAFSNYFDLKWDEYRPESTTLEKLISNDQKITVAAFLKRDDKFIFAIPERYLDSSPTEILFHAIGGKKEIHETFTEALNRESLQEIDATLQIVSNPRTRYFTSGGEMRPINISNNPQPFCIYKRTRETDVNLAPKEMWLIGYEATIRPEAVIKPSSEVAALLILTGDMLIKTLHDEITYNQINCSIDGSSVIIKEGCSFDYNKFAVPTGLATIIATDQRPKLLKNL